MKNMKVIIAVDKNPTANEMAKITEAKLALEAAGMKVELIGTRPNDR